LEVRDQSKHFVKAEEKIKHWIKTPKGVWTIALLVSFTLIAVVGGAIGGTLGFRKIQ
jgi:hypothetical protein